MNGTVCHRVTFSYAVAELIARRSGMQLVRGEVREGTKLDHEDSPTGFYAVCSKNKILRVAMSREIAELLCDYDSRYLAVAYVRPRHGVS
jgi:hypothetical protein